MAVLDHLGQAAAVLLLIELLVFLLIFLAVAGGLAFGLRWVNGKTEWAFGKANSYLPVGQRYLDKGLELAVAPIIKASTFADTVKGTVRALERHMHVRRSAEPTQVAARPVPRTGEDETTRIEPLPLI